LFDQRETSQQAEEYIQKIIQNEAVEKFRALIIADKQPQYDHCFAGHLAIRLSVKRPFSVLFTFKVFLTVPFRELPYDTVCLCFGGCVLFFYRLSRYVF